MSVVATVPKLLTVEEYLRLPDPGKPTELVRGRVEEMTPPTPYHCFVCGRVFKFVERFVEEGDLGWVMPNDSGVLTERNPDTLRGADVCFYSYTRIPREAMPLEGYVGTVPELVFEVMSPSDRWTQVLEKVTEYLRAGITVVCVVNPRARTVTAYRDNQDPEPFAADAELTIPDVLPGFRVPIRRMFE